MPRSCSLMFVCVLCSLLLLAGGAPVQAVSTPWPQQIGQTFDPDLEPGFPVRAVGYSGTYHIGPVLASLVANIDPAPGLEILATSLAVGPLNAWHADGTVVQGWPGPVKGAAYAAAGNLVGDAGQLEVVTGFFYGGLEAYSAGRTLLPGWPQAVRDEVYAPPALADLDGDGHDEIISDVGVYRANGERLPGFFSGGVHGSPAVGDIDADGRLEIVFQLPWRTDRSGLGGYDDDGSELAGNFPIIYQTYVDGYPVIGDVDGDGSVEIVTVAEDRVGQQDSGPFIYILSGSGVLERKMPAAGRGGYGRAPALGDLDGDGIPEIALQTGNWLNVWRGDGTLFPGWPQATNAHLGDAWSSAPVIGDVDGDGQPDIAVTHSTEDGGQVLLFNSHGVLHPRFPKHIALGDSAVPAIADIDLDCRNELVVSTDFHRVTNGTNDKVFVYDLHGEHYGPILWGQFMGAAHRRGVYPPPPPPQPAAPITGGHFAYLPLVNRTCR